MGLRQTACSAPIVLQMKVPFKVYTREPDELGTFPSEPCGFHRGNLWWVQGSRSDAFASATAAGRTRQGLDQ